MRPRGRPRRRSPSTRLRGCGGSTATRPSRPWRARRSAGGSRRLCQRGSDPGNHGQATAWQAARGGGGRAGRGGRAAGAGTRATPDLVRRRRGGRPPAGAAPRSVRQAADRAGPGAATGACVERTGLRRLRRHAVVVRRGGPPALGVACLDALGHAAPGDARSGSRLRRRRGLAARIAVTMRSTGRRSNARARRGDRCCRPCSPIPQSPPP